RGNDAVHQAKRPNDATYRRNGVDRSHASARQTQVLSCTSNRNWSRHAEYGERRRKEQHRAAKCPPAGTKAFGDAQHGVAEQGDERQEHAGRQREAPQESRVSCSVSKDAATIVPDRECTQSDGQQRRPDEQADSKDGPITRVPMISITIVAAPSTKTVTKSSGLAKRRRSS